MSRLFCTVDSDAREKQERITVYEKVDVEVSWGSLKKSKQLIRVYVDWKRGEEKPTILIDTDQDCDVRWNTNESPARDKRGTGGRY